MDILSEVLQVVRLSGVIHFNAEFSAPWAIISSEPAALCTRLRAESVTPFHVFVGGHCLVKLGHIDPIRIQTGDVIVLPRGDQHVMASDLSVPPVPTRDIYPGTSSERIPVVKHGGGGEPARFICGFLYSDQRFGPLLNSLPLALCVRTRIDGLTLDTPGPDGWSAQPLSNPHEAGLWQSSLQYLIRETAQPGPGNRAVLARLSEFLFMELLRWQLRTSAESGSGWLAGLHDPHVGRALQLMHAEPARAWSVQDLARQSALSRASLGKKFVALVGHSPMQYLAIWRMHLARNLLRESRLSVGEIAERVGYASAAAFNRTFSNLVGTPPATWRRAHVQGEPP